MHKWRLNETYTTINFDGKYKGFDMRDYTTINFDGMRRDNSALMGGLAIIHVTYTELKICILNNVQFSSQFRWQHTIVERKQNDQFRYNYTMHIL